MDITIWEITDQLNKNDHIAGIGAQGQKNCDEFIAHNQEYQGGERYELRVYPANIHFIWDMAADEFKYLMTPDVEEYEEPIYCGALFFGNFKLEFMKKNFDGCHGYRNLFQYGAEDRKGDAYGYLEDGTPYEERYPESDDIILPYRRTFRSFAENVEKQVINLLNAHPEFIKDAIKGTIPANWYPGERHLYTKDFSREA